MDQGRRALCRAGALAPLAWAAPGAPSKAAGEIRLLARADDMGSSHGANVGCLRTFREGIVRSVEVIVPGPWFPEAVRLLGENPGLDVGVHLCLTSEWEGIKWRPLTAARTLVDRDGYLRPTVWRRDGQPAGEALREARFELGEVERELRAQIELLRRHVPRTSHLSGHMGATGATPALAALTARLAAEYKLGGAAAGAGATDAPRLGRLPVAELPAATRGDPAVRERALVDALAAVGPGDYLMVEHPATGDPEMQAHGHPGYRDVAAERSAATAALTSKKVKEVIERRRIRLISYRDLRS